MSNNNKYLDTIKMEFQEIMLRFVESNRKSFHAYTIHRALSLGLLIGNEFRYISSPERNFVIIELDLQEDNSVKFFIDTESGYGNLMCEDDTAKVSEFISNFDVRLSKDTYRRRPSI